MKSKKSPSTPDPYQTAQAQQGVNADTARTQAKLNRGNTVSALGTVTNRDMGDDQWETTTTLSPEQQILYDQDVQLDTQTGQLALDQIPQIRELLAQPYATDDADARDRATAGFMSRMEPEFARDREGLEGRLLAQGFVPGSEGYARAADELGRSRTDARMQAITAGLGESRAGAAFSNAIRGQRVNELGMLFGLGSGSQTPTAADTADVAVEGTDLMGQIQSNYASKVGQQQATNANWFGLLGAGANAAGSYYGGQRGGGGGYTSGVRGGMGRLVGGV